MSKGLNYAVLSTWTSGDGIVVGSNVDVSGVWIGTAATTLTLLVDGVSFLTLSGANTFIGITIPIAVTGTLSGTSSGGSFAVAYRKRQYRVYLIL